MWRSDGGWVRFDDSLRTVLAADATTAFGAQSAFRQLVDLIGRRRVDPSGEPIARLRALRDQVPAATRAASARALALADPPAELVAFFAEDEPAVAAPLLRSARLADAEWLAVLPRLGPAGRAVLRTRPAMSGAVVRALETFGATDFTLRHDRGEPDAADQARDPPPPDETRAQPTGQTFAIAELVQRIDEFQRERDDRGPAQPARVDRFEFETDPSGVITWVDGVPRAGLVGRALGADPTISQPLTIVGQGELAGEWLVSRAPVYASDTGRRLGDRGLARRVANEAGALDADALRRLVHELRTPLAAIAGFAELIATALLGPVPQAYGDRAAAIGRDAAALIVAIEDLETSARIDSGALDLRPGTVDVAAALADAVASVGADRLAVTADPGLGAVADDRALARLLARLTSLAIEAVPTGEARTVSARRDGGEIIIVWPWPAERADASLLGAEFTIRLAHKLARALGGRLATAPDRLTLHLPASITREVQAAIH